MYRVYRMYPGLTQKVSKVPHWMHDCLTPQVMHKDNNYIETFNCLHLLLMVAYATQLPQNYEMSHICVSFPIYDNFQAFSQGLFETQLVKPIQSKDALHPQYCPTQSNLNSYGASGNHDGIPPLPPFFATSHFDPKGPFIFQKRCFWPHLAPTHSIKKGLFSRLEASNVSL